MTTPTQAQARALVEEVKRKHEQAGNVCLGHWLSTAHPCDASRLASALEASLKREEGLREKVKCGCPSWDQFRALRGALEKSNAALMELVDAQGVEHQAAAGPDGDAEDCPEDDSCRCPLIAQVNAAITSAREALASTGAPDGK
jgi:hypothetical protein